MRPPLWLALAWAASAAAAPLLPATPLEPAYHALLSGDRAGAWRQLDVLGAALSSAAQRQAWLALQHEMVAGQCGRDAPAAPPAWLGDLELDLIQRDIPLSRSYIVRLNGVSPRRDLRWSLRLPDGRELLAGAKTRYDGRQFELESEDQSAALPPGVCPGRPTPARSCGPACRCCAPSSAGPSPSARFTAWPRRWASSDIILTIVYPFCVAMRSIQMTDLREKA
ncbi:DUF2861 family protein [Chromobacterium piscinae]|uniref:DUF2861 family protein n=1 Tax=Chromobacterium piscinae TaxID=686831 RepID=UPI0032610FAB